MEDIQKKVLAKLLRDLNSFKDHIRFAVEVEGRHFMGNAELKPARTVAASHYPRGTFSSYVRPYFKGCKAGDTIRIHPGPFTARDIVSACSSTGVQFLGVDCVVTSFNKATGFVECYIKNMDRAPSSGLVDQHQFDAWHAGKPGKMHVDWRKVTGFTGELPTPPAEAPASLQQGELEDFIAQLDEKFGGA